MFATLRSGGTTVTASSQPMQTHSETSWPTASTERWCRAAVTVGTHTTSRIFSHRHRKSSRQEPQISAHCFPAQTTDVSVTGEIHRTMILAIGLVREQVSQRRWAQVLRWWPAGFTLLRLVARQIQQLPARHS